MKQTICPHCGEKENFHFNYDYAQKHMPIINVLCNECGEFFDNNKEQQDISKMETTVSKTERVGNIVPNRLK
jgi:uncharacterized Zn finger protein